MIGTGLMGWASFRWPREDDEEPVEVVETHSEDDVDDTVTEVEE
jgi:hypothetical protein